MRTRHGSCGGEWWQSGNRTGHCGSCHRAFQGTGAFDRHRRDGACIDPATAVDKHGEPAFVWAPGTHGFDTDVTYYRLPSEAFDAGAVFA